MIRYPTKFGNFNLYKIFIPIFISNLGISQQLPNTVTGTSIIGYIKNDTIWVASDSRATFISGEDTVSQDDAIKIHEVDDYIIANAGFNNSRDYLFNIADFLKTDQGKPDPASYFKTLCNFINLGVFMYFQILNHPHGFNDTIIYRDTIFYSNAYEVMFPYFDSEGVPHISVYGAFPKIDADGNCKTIPFTINPLILKDSSLVYRLGIFNTIDSLVNNGAFSSYSPVEDILVNLVNAQSESSSFVGGKVDVIRITKNGTFWVYDKRKAKK